MVCSKKTIREQQIEGRWTIIDKWVYGALKRGEGAGRRGIDHGQGGG